MKKILADNGGKIKYDALKKHLKAQGYPDLIKKLEAMGFFVDVDGFVRELG